MEQIRIKNFGPIVDATIDIRDYNVFIGPTSSGKSIIAKLISIFKSVDFILGNDYDEFLDACESYNIKSFLKENSEIKYLKDKFSWTFKVKGEKLNANYNVQDIGFIRAAIQVLEVERISEILAKSQILTSPKSNKTPSQLNALYVGLHNVLKGYHENALSKDFVEKSNREVLSFYEQAVELLGICEITYIPAERIILSMVAESIFGMLSKDISIPECVKNFGALFERARKDINSLDIDFLGARYEYDEKGNRIVIGEGNEISSIRLDEASSGFQSLVPFFVVLAYIYKNSKKRRVLLGQINQNKAKGYLDPFQYKNLIIIEEPELSLYPTMQKELIERTISICKASESKLIITTHSPYIITTIDNLIAAQNVIDEKPGSEKEVDKLVDKEKRISHENVSCYYIDNGNATDIFDRESKAIKSFMIDDVSESLGSTFDKLLDLRYS